MKLFILLIAFYIFIKIFKRFSKKIENKNDNVIDVDYEDIE